MTFNNLSTDGSEFVLPGGRRYRGRYHIHVSNGAMVGPRHVPTFHQKLRPINSSVAQRISSLQQQLRGQELNRQKIQSTRPSSPPPSTGSSSGGGY